MNTFVGVAARAAVVFMAEGVPDRQQPASRAVHVAMTGAPAPQVPQKDILAGAPHQCHSPHGGHVCGDTILLGLCGLVKSVL